jgi:N-acetylmuramic acid 6-phosphate etherase
VTEGIDPRYAEFEAWPMEQRVRALIEANERAVAAAVAAVPALTLAAEGIAVRLAGGGRLVYAGAGTSGRLSLQDAAELPPTFDFERTEVLLAGGADAGTTAKEGAEDEVEAAAAAVDAAAVGPDDALVGIAASGRTPYTVAAVRRARERGAFTVGIANNPGTPLLAAADVAVLLDTGPEVVAGSTRMVAGTAQKIALNALSSAPMVELGAVHGNLMVAMRPTNAKLRHRAVDIVAAASGTTLAEAERALRACGGDIRCAIVHLGSGLEPAAASALLARHGGRASLALAAHARR